MKSQAERDRSRLHTCLPLGEQDFCHQWKAGSMYGSEPVLDNSVLLSSSLLMFRGITAEHTVFKVMALSVQSSGVVVTTGFNPCVQPSHCFFHLAVFLSDFLTVKITRSNSTMWDIVLCKSNPLLDGNCENTPSAMIEMWPYHIEMTKRWNILFGQQWLWRLPLPMSATVCNVRYIGNVSKEKRNLH